MTDNLYHKTNFSYLIVGKSKGSRDCGQILECYNVYLRYRTDHSHPFRFTSSVRYCEHFGVDSPKVLVIPRKQWLRPNMTEKLLTGTLRINQPTNQPTNQLLGCQN